MLVLCNFLSVVGQGGHRPVLLQMRQHIILQYANGSKLVAKKVSPSRTLDEALVHSTSQHLILVA